MKAAVCLRMNKWPHELSEVPVDSYLFVAEAVKTELEALDAIRRKAEELR